MRRSTSVATDDAFSGELGERLVEGAMMRFGELKIVESARTMSPVDEVLAEREAAHVKAENAASRGVSLRGHQATFTRNWLLKSAPANASGSRHVAQTWNVHRLSGDLRN
jgi:hypothetical protein